VTLEAARHLAAALTALADDELVLAHRDSEWTGHAPILEEDIAFANIALDELGHATIWHRLAADLIGADPDLHPDAQVFHRPPESFRNIRLVERPRGDWAYTILRQYFFDTVEALRLERLVSSTHLPLAQAAAKILTEERYHLRHGRAWVRRLGLGTDESRRRMQAALDAQWGDLGQLTAPFPFEADLVASGAWPPARDVSARWEDEIRAFLTACEIDLPGGSPPEAPGRDVHTEHLAELVTELQAVAGLEADATW
jgi:ring-1,2-phenylacetyl-CoA epoxidase subunit PaaC